MSDGMRVAMLISGGGTTMASIMDACKEGGVLHGKVNPVLVISSKPNAGGKQKALDRGLTPANIIDIGRHTHPNFLERGKAIVDACKFRGVDFIGQYGWVLLTPPNVIETFPGMMVNQHPGPLRTGRRGFGGPGLMGTAVHTAVLWFARSVPREFPFTEAVAHRVTEKYDEGGLLKVRQVPINLSLKKGGDDVSSLQQRVLPVEHQVQIETLRDFADGQVQEIDLPDIVLPGEEWIHDLALHTCRILYPHG